MSSRSDIPTKLIYQWDETLREHLTKVVSVRPFLSLSPAEQALFKTGTEQTRVIECVETIFYAQGGGQPSDTGAILASNKAKYFNVEAVRYGTGWKIFHFGQFKDSNSFNEGEMVTQQISGTRRDLNSRLHTAGHIISLAVRRVAAETPELEVTEFKASHYPDACFVDFRGIIDGKHKEAIQRQATAFVDNSLPIKLSWYAPQELEKSEVIMAEGMPIVTGAEGKVRVVDIVGAGAYPCGGTHVQHSGLVGEVVVRNIKRQKGVSKVSYTIVEKAE